MQVNMNPYQVNFEKNRETSLLLPFFILQS